MKAFRILFALLMVVSLLSSCKTNNGSKPVAGVAKDFHLEIYHQGCRGSCPDYRIKVDAAGNATYHGRHSVEMMGKYAKVLEGKVVKELESTIEKYKFFEMEDVYGGGVADLPEIHTTVTMDGNTKKVVDIRYAPKELKEMEARLETLIGMEGWEKTE